MSATDRQAKIKSVFIVSSGNFLEMYDFMVFGYYASAIGRARRFITPREHPCKTAFALI